MVRLGASDVEEVLVRRGGRVFKHRAKYVHISKSDGCVFVYVSTDKDRFYHVCVPTQKAIVGSSIMLRGLKSDSGQNVSVEARLTESGLEKAKLGVERAPRRSKSRRSKSRSGSRSRPRTACASLAARAARAARSKSRSGSRSRPRAARRGRA